MQLTWKQINKCKANLLQHHLEWLMFNEPENDEAIEIIERKVSIYNKLALI